MTDGQTNGQTDGQTDQWTDGPTKRVCRVTCTQLKILQCFIYLISSLNRYLYTGLMPSPKLDGGMVPIFYFLNASHTENAFRECLHKFYYDVKRVKMSMPRYEHCSLAPKQCITDMSLVIFRPALGKWNFCVLILKRYRGPISCRTRSEFQNIHPIFCYPLLPFLPPLAIKASYQFFQPWFLPSHLKSYLRQIGQVA